ncbi:MAG TPA: iron-sulfur cluster assembly scaffold protein [bacterium]|nr:iron-sulfur cluster assembly scaffold protein [bacterium]
MSSRCVNADKTPEAFFVWLRDRFPEAGGFIDVSAPPEDSNIGPLDNADANGTIHGICGDTMEIWLKIENGVVTDARYATNGCFSSRACGAAATYLAKGERIIDALGISPRDVMNLLELIPGVDIHCSILAISTLYRAIAEYILKGNISVEMK